MRIGIDARKLHDFGIGTYIRNLLRHLARIDSQTEFVIFCRPEDRETLAAVGENFRPVLETSGNYSIAEQVRIPWALRREGVTLFHAPHYVLPPLVQCRSVVTIHDVIHLMFPQYLPNRVALSYAKWSITEAARRSTRVMTVSESSKRDILRFVATEPDKIDVIYNAYDERFAIEPREEDVVRVRERYQLTDEFVLYAGNVKPHKNLERLIDAFAIVRKRGLDHLKLVLIGDEISKYTRAAPRRAPAPAAQVRAVSRLFAGGNAGGDVPARRRLRLSIAVRRLRPAAARSDGQRHAGRDLERVVAARSRRRRGGPRRSVPIRRRSPTGSTAC